MSEFNDYKWYEDDHQKNDYVTYDNQGFYTEMVNNYKRKKKHRTLITAAICLAAVIMISSVGLTTYVLINGSPLADNRGKVTAKTETDKNASFNFEQLSDGERTPKSTVDIAKEVGPTVVGVINKTLVRTFFGQTVEQDGSGSGIIISSDGYVVTNNHVVEGAKELKVVLNTGKEYPAKLVGSDTKTDLAVVKIETSDLPVATLGDSDKLQAGELAVAIGNPLGQELAGTVTVGVISAVNRSIQTDNSTMTLVQTDAAINPGNSGGALVNAYGEIIGINSMKFSGDNVEGIGFAIPINTAKPIVSDLIANGYVKGRPLIGISLREISAEIAAINDLPAGLQVADVAQGGAADLAGIKKGDVITAVDGKVVETVKQVNEIKDSHKSGDVITVQVSRDGTKMEFKVTLQEDKSARQSG